MYNLLSGRDLRIAELIKQRRLQILVHSCIYYKFNESIISDSDWSRWAVELYELQKKYPLIADMTSCAPYFKNFDPSSGFDLKYDDDWIVSKAKQLMKLRGIKYDE